MIAEVPASWTGHSKVYKPIVLTGIKYVIDNGTRVK